MLVKIRQCGSRESGAFPGCCDDWDWNQFKKLDPTMQGDKKLLEGWKECVTWGVMPEGAAHRVPPPLSLSLGLWKRHFPFSPLQSCWSWLSFRVCGWPLSCTDSSSFQWHFFLSSHKSVALKQTITFLESKWAPETDRFNFVAVQLLSPVWLFATPWTAAHQASLPSLPPGVCSNSCPLSQWCHPTVSSSVLALVKRKKRTQTISWQSVKVNHLIWQQ